MTNHSALDREDGTGTTVDSPAKVAATCTDCGRTYASTKRADGVIRPIGRPSGCSCGGTTFELFHDEANAG